MSQIPRIELRVIVSALYAPETVGVFPATGAGALAARDARPPGQRCRIVLVGRADEVDLTAALQAVRADDDDVALRRRVERDTAWRYASGGRIGFGS